MTEHGDRAAGGVQQAEQQFDRGALARTVGAEQSKNLAALYLQIETANRLDLGATPEVAERLAQSAGFDDGIGVGGWWRDHTVNVKVKEFRVQCRVVRLSAPLGLIGFVLFVRFTYARQFTNQRERP